MQAPPTRAMPWKAVQRPRLLTLAGRLLMGRALTPSPDEWQAVLAALQRGDPAMDAVVEWLCRGATAEKRRQFEQALTQGIETLTDPPAVLRDFFAGVEQPPAWLDRDLLAQGAQAAHIGGQVGFYVLRDMALMGGYVYFNSMNQVLAPAGELSRHTSRRLGETGTWLYDVTEPDGMSRFGQGFITTLRVRLVHALIRRHLSARDDWDQPRWGVPINQVDMQSTYLAFGPVALSGGRLFGVLPSRQASAASMHLWRYIGWLMGVDEARLAVTERDGLRKLYHTFLTHRCPDDKIHLLGSALRDEPLERLPPPASRWPRLLAWWRYQVHLSNSSLILGLRERRLLGLPWWILPWFPAITAPWRFLRVLICRVRGAKAIEALAQRDRLRQRQQLQEYFGDRQATIIQPSPEHPAHIK
ncbi:DUF2236 domain-containing protein [Alcanivorax sp. JB21]|uniref:oxygenase MpaB family protein n=1 Tax=Alcanivorax limicola TaxID=2874102 RepID=UPI001CBEE0B5|nr:oxygenase MpaB family protein [Alcanivorax limicola]MBZ2188269.1 DUF2236 domain-containing protein [Alcanivorax limicola]